MTEAKTSVMAVNCAGISRPHQKYRSISSVTTAGAYTTSEEVDS